MWSRRRCLGLRRDRGLDRGRFLPRARALAHRQARPRARRWKPTRCISPPTCGRRSRCWSGSAACASDSAWADSAAALAVALLVCVAGWRLGRRTIDTLTDTAPAGAAETDRGDRRARARRGRGRAACARAPVGDNDCSSISTVAVSRTLPLDRVNAIKDGVAAAIRASMPGAEPIVVIAPGRARQRNACSTA